MLSWERPAITSWRVNLQQKGTLISQTSHRGCHMICYIYISRAYDYVLYTVDITMQRL